MLRRVHLLILRLFGVLPRPVRNGIVRLISPTFTAGVMVALLDGAGSIFLVTHSYSTGWGMPGGLMARGESAAESATRELREELGLAIHLEDNALPVQTPGRAHFNFVFATRLDPRLAPTDPGPSPEIAGCGWFRLDGLPELSEYTDMFLARLGLLPPTQGKGPTQTLGD